MAVLKAIQNGECKSYGGIAFWNGSVHKQFKVERLIFRKATLLSLPFQIAMFVALLSVLGFWWWNAFGRMIAGASWIIEMINNNTSIEETTSNLGYISLCLLLLEALGIIATSMGAYKFVHFFRFIVSRDASQMTGRGFAPFRHGPMGIDCLRAALASSQNYARDRGYGIWLLNVDERHPDTAAFSKSGFQTKFLQKWLLLDKEEKDDTNKTWKPFDLGAFCDPRDL